MARSIKKNAYIKDSGSYKNYMQKLSHSRVRLEVKRRLKKGEWDTMPLNRELTNQWDICDWSTYYDDCDLLRFNEWLLINDRQDIKYYDYAFPWTPDCTLYKGKYRLRK